MNELVSGTAANKRSPHVPVFVASNDAGVKPWFETNLPKGWKLIEPARESPKPDSGVWFGQHGSKCIVPKERTLWISFSKDDGSQVC
jgi:hypothetical protein